MVERLSVVGVQLALRLGEHNSPRPCGECKTDAEYYVFDEDSRVSAYVCGDHYDETISRAQR